MDHPIIIDRKGKTQRTDNKTRALRAAMIEIDSWSLTTTKYFMNQTDYEDIFKWGKVK